MTQVLNIIRLGERTVRADKVKFWRLIRVNPHTDKFEWIDPAAYVQMIDPLPGVIMLGETDDGQPISVVGPEQEIIARVMAVVPVEGKQHRIAEID